MYFRRSSRTLSRTAFSTDILPSKKSGTPPPSGMLLRANHQQQGGGKRPDTATTKRGQAARRRPLVTVGLARRCGQAARGAGVLAVVGGRGALVQGAAVCGRGPNAQRVAAGIGGSGQGAPAPARGGSPVLSAHAARWVRLPHCAPRCAVVGAGEEGVAPETPIFIHTRALLGHAARRRFLAVHGAGLAGHASLRAQTAWRERGLDGSYVRRRHRLHFPPHTAC
jgi:hypothetical protein